jgi:hypothetical protein
VSAPQTTAATTRQQHLRSLETQIRDEAPHQRQAVFDFGGEEVAIVVLMAVWGVMMLVRRIGIKGGKRRKKT